jgi:hypothetical protein
MNPPVPVTADNPTPGCHLLRNHRFCLIVWERARTPDHAWEDRTKHFRPNLPFPWA